jgi:hypothetical protein
MCLSDNNVGIDITSGDEYKTKRELDGIYRRYPTTEHALITLHSSLVVQLTLQKTY